jgi:sugar lactone lactonase YvrE
MPLTLGASGMDFTTAPGTACDPTVNYQVGSQCTVSVVFTPKYPGRRMGAIVVTDGGGHLLGETLLSASANGSLSVLVGDIQTVAGDGELLYRGDGVPATTTPVYLPQGVIEDAAGNLYISDTQNNRIRKVATSGVITTVAGTGAPGYTGDGGAATAAAIEQPAGLILDGAGNIYFADSGNNAIRRIDAASGVITTVAGGGGTPALSTPRGLAFNAAGDLYIADTGNNVIRVISSSTGVITTVAGTGVGGYNGDGQPATAAQLNTPWSVSIGPDGLLYIADLGNNLVRKVSAGGVISNIAGTGARGFSGDGGAAVAATLNDPAALAFNPAGDLYIADSGNNRIRRVYANGEIATLAGNGSEQFTGDGGPASAASLYAPYAVFFDQAGNLFLSDMLHNRIREIPASPTLLNYADIRVGKTSPPQSQQVENDGNDNLVFNVLTPVNAALDSGSTTCLVGVPLSPDANCILGLEFQPTTTGTPVYGSVTAASNAGNSSSVMNLYGNVLSVDPVTVMLTSSSNPSLVGTAVTFTATIASEDSNVSGPVTFLDGAMPICNNVPLSATVASCTTSALSLGQHNITASYGGDSNNEAKTSSILVQTVQQTPTVALTASLNPAVVGTSITLTVNVTAATGTPTGAVTFYDGGTAISGSLTLNNGVATFSTTQLAPGPHALTVQYTGDTNDAAGTSNAVSEVINQSITTTTLGSSNGNAYVGMALAFTATVTSADGATLSGSVTFNDGNKLLGTATLAGNGIATLSISTLAPGTHSIVTIYSGDRNDAGSSSAPFTQVIQQIPTTTMLSSDAGTVSAGATVHLTATVAIAGSTSADGTIDGSVVFTDGTATLGTVPLGANGQAMLAVILPAGTQGLVATYVGDTNYATSTSNTLTVVVTTTSTTTALSASSASILAGKPVTFTAVVTSSTGVPTGSVTFTDGATVLGTSALFQSAATYTTSTLAVGTNAITATYNGDANYLSSRSTAFTEVVSLATTTLVLAGPPKTDVGTTLTLTGTLSSNGVIPTGVFTLMDSGVAIATQNVTASGLFSFSTSALSLGTHSLTLSYGGDNDNASSVSPAVTAVVQQAPTTTAFSSSASRSTLGQPLTLTAGVTSDGPGISGSVSFYDGAILLGSVVLSNGSASFTTSSLAFGSHNLTAVYTGETNHSASTSAIVAEQIVEAATIVVSSSANPSISGNNVVFTATAAEVGSVMPTGTLVFRDGTNALGSVTLDATGTATYSTSSLIVGMHTISVNYAGDGNYAAGSATLTETIQNANTQVVLTSSANPAVYAAPLNLVATLTSNGGVATGAVTFTDGGTAIGSAVLNANGVATLTLSTLAPGTHSIAASYAGDGKAGGSVSTPLALTVLQTSTVGLTSSANPTLTLSPLVLTATVSNSVGQPTGTVTFTDGSTLLGSVMVGTNGVTTLTVPSLGAGSHMFVASYSGDGKDVPSTSSALAQVVQLRSTATTVTGTETDPTNPQQVTLIGVVHYTGAASATGTMTFASGTTTLGSSTVDATGVASLTVIFQSTTETIVASYSGDTSYAASTSSPTTITSGAATQFTLALSPTAMSMASKQHGTATLTITSIKSFSDTLALGCLGLPYAATCTFSTTKTNLAANETQTVQLTVDTGNPLGSGATAAAGFGSGRMLLLTLPLTLLLSFGLWRKRRKAPVLLLITFAVGLVISATGCAGLTTNGTPAGTYTFYVTGTGQRTGASQSQAVTLTVTQ